MIRLLGPQDNGSLSVQRSDLRSLLVATFSPIDPDYRRNATASQSRFQFPFGHVPHEHFTIIRSSCHKLAIRADGATGAAVTGGKVVVAERLNRLARTNVNDKEDRRQTVGQNTSFFSRINADRRDSALLDSYCRPSIVNQSVSPCWQHQQRTIPQRTLDLCRFLGRFEVPKQ
jgi:hypothetical protein